MTAFVASTNKSSLSGLHWFVWLERLYDTFLDTSVDAVLKMCKNSAILIGRPVEDDSLVIVVTFYGGHLTNT